MPKGCSNKTGAGEKGKNKPQTKVDKKEETCPVKKMWSLDQWFEARLESLEFLSDHVWSQGQTEDGQDISGQKVLRPSPSGQCYPFTYDSRLRFDKPEWIRSPAKSDPISHNRNSLIQVKITISFDSDGDYRIRHIRGTPGGSNQEYMHFEGDCDISIQSGRSQQTFDMVSFGPLPNSIQDLRDLYVRWEIQAESQDWKGSVNIGNSGPHRIYVTFGSPKFAPWPASNWRTWWPEDGLTCARMERAIAMVQPMNTDDTHKISNTIRSWFPNYIFKTHLPAAPYGHSAFMVSELGGAWCLSDFIQAGGECQAIVRLMRAVMNQLGCDGKWEMRVIYASPHENAGKKALDGPWPERGGTSTIAPMQANHDLYGKQFSLSYYVDLMDDYQMFHWEEVHKDARANSYEAALRVEYKGETYYYGGGAARYSTATDVLRDFSALIWSVNYPLQTGEPKLPEQLVKFCAQVIQNYDQSGNDHPGQLRRLPPPQLVLPPHPHHGQQTFVPLPPSTELGAPTINNPSGECKAPSFGVSGDPAYAAQLPGLQQQP